MKLLKIIPLLLVFTLFNTNVNAAQDCGEIKGNIVGKLFCKAKTNYGGSGASEASNSTEESSGWKLWKKPEWMKKKN